jgi:hypothetical protein
MARNFYPTFSPSPCSVAVLPVHLRGFDLVIVDEASQMTEPACLAALRHGRAFALLGDPQQLQPLVLSPATAARPMRVSLMQRLAVSGTGLLGLSWLPTVVLPCTKRGANQGASVWCAHTTCFFGGCAGRTPVVGVHAEPPVSHVCLHYGLCQRLGVQRPPGGG